MLTLPDRRRTVLSAAITHLIEANAALRKRRALARLERQLATAMRKAFRQQATAFLSRLVLVKSQFAESAIREVAEIAWQPAFDDAALATLQAFQTPLDEVTAQALASGARAAIADLALDTAFDLKNPRAVAYMQAQGAARVSQITETSRGLLRTLMTTAVDEGWSYGRASREIRALFAGFSTRRAKNIAIFELGDSYEAGNLIVAKDLQDAGLIMQKSWLSAGDAKVRPEHQANAAAGWIDLDASYPSGDDRPPTDPSCRCSSLHRRKPTE